jgi:hypothetical protein
MTTALISTTKIVVNNDLTFVLKDCKVGKQRYVKKHITVEDNASRCYAQGMMNRTAREQREEL